MCETLLNKDNKKAGNSVFDEDLLFITIDCKIFLTGQSKKKYNIKCRSILALKLSGWR